MDVYVCEREGIRTLYCTKMGGGGGGGGGGGLEHFILQGLRDTE